MAKGSHYYCQLALFFDIINLLFSHIHSRYLLFFNFLYDFKQAEIVFLNLSVQHHFKLVLKHARDLDWEHNSEIIEIHTMTLLDVKKLKTPSTPRTPPVLSYQTSIICKMEVAEQN